MQLMSDLFNAGGFKIYTTQYISQFVIRGSGKW